ncbi:MAG: amidase [Hyphomicrobiaceae bacterium]
MTNLHYRTAKQLAQMVRRKKISAVELLDHHLKRVSALNTELNAVIAMDTAGAKKRARAVDAAIAKGEAVGPLAGVPMTVKESFDVAGLATTWGVPELKDSIAKRNAIAVDRLLAAGAVVFGKTNVPIYLADWQSFNVIYGTTNNPWDLTLSPGGSSGGSAVALAAGLSALELGSDIGASIRNPAHYCGVFGHKPTWGICTPRGQALPGVVAASDISVIGPLARSVDDLDLALSVVAGPDDIDGVGWSLDLPPPRKERVAELRVAVMLDDPCSEVDLEVQDRVSAVARMLGREGAKISYKARPAFDTAEANRIYILLLRAATSGRMPQAAFEKASAAARRIKDDDDRYLSLMMRGQTLHHRGWLALNNRRHQMRLAWADFFKDWDVLLCPAAASAAMPHDHAGERHDRKITVNGKRVPTTDQLFWAGYSGLAYLPSTIAPAGLTPKGLPVGVQIVGPQYGDRTTIHVARMIERELGGFVPPPSYT